MKDSGTANQEKKKTAQDAGCTGRPVHAAAQKDTRFAKRDILLLAVILAVFLIIFGVYRLTHAQTGAVAVITVDGEEYGRYSLEEDQTIPILIDGEETNRLIIQDHEADMISADCPDQLCVHEKAISKNGETIVCLPNEVVVTVESDEEAEFDTIAQ